MTAMGSRHDFPTNRMVRPALAWSTVRAFVPTQPLLDGTYKLPNVQRKGANTGGPSARRHSSAR
jgi:hypothetical protein